jgi:hypothetical protein
MELPDDELDQTRELCRDVIGARCPACKRTLLTLMLGLLVLLFAPRLSAAGVSGKWNGYFTTTVNPNQTVFLLELKNSAGKLTGKITFCGHACDPERSVDVGIEDARMSRNRVSFYVATGEPDVPNSRFQGHDQRGLIQIYCYRQIASMRSGRMPNRPRFSQPHALV